MDNRTWSADSTDELGGRSRSPHRRWWIAPFALLLVAGFFFALRPSPRPVMHKTIGHRLSELRLEGLTGADRAIRSEDLTGSVVLINFWGTWCRPCLTELPHLAELGKKFSTRGDFQLLAVSAGQSESADDLANLRRDTLAFLKYAGADIPTYADPGNATFEAFCDLARNLDPSTMEGVPTTILLDRQGIIRGVWIGYLPGLENEMEEMVERLLDDEGK